MAPPQQAMSEAWKAATQSGAQSSTTANRQAHAAALFPGALERRGVPRILLSFQSTPRAQVRKFNKSKSGTRAILALGVLTVWQGKSQTQVMAHIYMQFDFGKDEEKAQVARHKLETWKQAFRLDKKLLYKFERIPDGAAPEPVAAKAATAKTEKSKGKTKAKEKEEPEAPASNENVKLLLRLAFSSHEKLSEQRWVQRIPTEEPFQAASPVVLKNGDARFAEVEKQFEELA